MTRNKWVIVAVAVVGVCFFVALTAIGLGVYAVASHVDIDRQPDEARVTAQFDELLSRFAGTTPLIVIDGHASRVVRSDADDELITTPVPETLHLMAWNREESGGSLFTLRLPFWLLRLGDDDDNNIDVDIDGHNVTLDLTIRDLERHGPGLVANYMGDGERVLVWSE